MHWTRGWPGALRLLLAAGLTATMIGCGSAEQPSGSLGRPSGGSPTPASNLVTPIPTTAPEPGHELYGFVPYWEMDASIVAHVAATPLSTVALFSVSNTAKGAIDTTQPGYNKIAGSVGVELITGAHRRGQRAELVFTSFGSSRNTAFFGRTSVQDATIASLVALVAKLGADGVDVDVESLDLALVGAYGGFVGRLRSALVARDARATLSVATGPGPTGAAMAAAALAAGADRVFLMGYDYRTSSSDPGAIAPIDRADSGRSLTWTLDLYAASGVDPRRLLLGLPLYGMAWPVFGPTIGSPALGEGTLWILRQHLDVLGSAAGASATDPVEGVDVYFLLPDGSVAPASAITTLDPSASPTTWTAAYVDSAATLERKLALGEARGLVGAGFWAIGYERGLPAYTDLMRRFVAGSIAAG